MGSCSWNEGLLLPALFLSFNLSCGSHSQACAAASCKDEQHLCSRSAVPQSHLSGLHPAPFLQFLTLFWTQFRGLRLLPLSPERLGEQESSKDRMVQKAKFISCCLCRFYALTVFAFVVVVFLSRAWQMCLIVFWLTRSGSGPPVHTHPYERGKNGLTPNTDLVGSWIAQTRSLWIFLSSKSCQHFQCHSREGTVSRLWTSRKNCHHVTNCRNVCWFAP